MKEREAVFSVVGKEYEEVVQKSDDAMRALKAATAKADAAEDETEVAKYELFKSNQDRDHLRGSDEAILMNELQEKVKARMEEIEAQQTKAKSASCAFA